MDEKPSSNSLVKHQSKSLEESKRTKNDLWKKAFSVNGTEEDRKSFREAVRAISDLKKKERKKEDLKTARHHTWPQNCLVMRNIKFLQK